MYTTLTIVLLIIWVLLISGKLFDNHRELENLERRFLLNKSDFNSNFLKIDKSMKQYVDGLKSLAKELGYEFERKSITKEEITEEAIAVKIKKGKK